MGYMADLDAAVARTIAGDEGSRAGIARIHASSGTGARAAAFLDAALDVGRTGAVAGFVITLGRAVACVLARARFAANGAGLADGTFGEGGRHESDCHASRCQAEEGDDVVHSVGLW